MALKQAPAVAYLSVLLLLSVTTFPSHVEATARLMPAAITGSGILRTSRVAQGSVRQLRQVYVTPEQVTESMSQFRAVDASLLKRVSEGQQDARVEYLNIMKGIIGCDGNAPRADPFLGASTALALRSTSGQYPELEPYIELRDSLIQEAQASVKASPATAAQCTQYQQLAQRLGIPKTATAVYGHRKAT